MKRSLVILIAAATVATAICASLYFGNESATGTVVVNRAASAKSCGDQKIFGHIKSLSSKGDNFEMRFDPAWFTSGVTANTAAAEDGLIPPGQPVPNDNHVVDESHRTLLYLVPAAAQVTVLTDTKNAAGNLYSTPITVSQLAQLVKGEAPVKLFEGLDTGFWMHLRVDTACSLDQQYHP
jgi:hypothetical protein